MLTRLRVALLAGVTAAALPAAAPAQAMTSTLSYNNGKTAYVEVVKVLERAGDGAEQMQDVVMKADCLFAVLPAVNSNDSRVALVGKVVVGPRVQSVLPAPTFVLPRAPIATVVICTASSATSFGVVTGAQPGGAAAAAGVVPTGFDAVTICVEARALFTDGRFGTVDKYCKDPDGL